MIAYLGTDGGQVIALGNVASIQGVATSRLRATIRPRLRLNSLSVPTLMSSTSEPDTDIETFLGAKALHPQKLDMRLSNEILRTLAERFEEVGPWLDFLEEAEIGFLMTMPSGSEKNATRSRPVLASQASRWRTMPSPTEFLARSQTLPNCPIRTCSLTTKMTCVRRSSEVRPRGGSPRKRRFNIVVP